MRSIVLLSGGQDSIVCAAWAQQQGEALALFVDYGQTHRQTEFESCCRAADKLGLELMTTRVDVLDGARVSSADPVVPGRNALLLSLAASAAATRQCDTVVIGACAADNAGFPDCRRLFIEVYNWLLRSAALDVSVVAPLLYATKAQTRSMAVQLGVLDLVLSAASCYHGNNCGECGACRAAIV